MHCDTNKFNLPIIIHSVGFTGLGLRYPELNLWRIAPEEDTEYAKLVHDVTSDLGRIPWFTVINIW